MSQDISDDQKNNDALPDGEFMQRFDQLTRSQQTIVLKKAEVEADAELKALKKEAADRRTKLLNAVRVTTPDINAPLIEKLESLEYEGKEFTSRDVATLLKAGDVKLSDAPDFFDLTVAQREDLLDRVGFYKGVVIDHRLSNPVEVSFHEVLARPEHIIAAAQDDNAGYVDTVLYRKPNFSGYFENYFTASEAVHQTQKNGVTNLKFSLAASAGMASTVAMGIGASYHRAEQENTGTVGKNVYTTANFFLPRIELSFDQLEPYASPKFENACRKAVLTQGTLKERFSALKRVLDSFGHFVSGQTLVGGRLFATEAKEFTGEENKSDVTERFAAELKVSLSMPTAEGEMSVSGDTGSQKVTRNKTGKESQSITFHAVGGEGAVVQNAAVWVESLYDYRRWAAVQRENLVPSIDILSESISKQCWDLLKEYASNNTKRTLLYDDGAWFLFYGAYGDDAGSLAEETFFSIENNAFNTAISLKSKVPVEKEPVILTTPDVKPEQLWRMNEQGYILSFMTSTTRTFASSKDINFALTVVGAEEKGRDNYDVIISQAGRAEYQTWEYPGSGEIINTVLGDNYILDTNESKRLFMRKRSPNDGLSRLWSFSVRDRYIIEDMKNDLPTEKTYPWFKLRAPDTGLVLSIKGAEEGKKLNATEDYQIVALPDIHGPHQLWQMNNDGNVVSAIDAEDGDKTYNVLLSLAKENHLLLAKPYSPWLMQSWKLDNGAQLVPASGESGVAACIIPVQGQVASGNSVGMLRDSTNPPQVWTQETATGKTDYTSFITRMLSDGRNTQDWTKMVDSSPLEINGRLTGLRLVVRLRGAGKVTWGEGYALQLEVAYRREDGSPQTIRHGEPLDSNMQEIVTGSPAAVDTRWLYLPAVPIHKIKLATANKPGKVLGFMYQLKPNGPWISLAADSATAKLPKMPDRETATPTAISQLSANESETIVAIGLDFNLATRLLSPKILVR